jgi:hypothetical protein
VDPFVVKRNVFYPALFRQVRTGYTKKCSEDNEPGNRKGQQVDLLKEIIQFQIVKFGAKYSEKKELPKGSPTLTNYRTKNYYCSLVIIYGKKKISD